MGFNLPSIENLKRDLIEKYKEVRLEKRQHLPEISELLVNDTLYIINNVHGGIANLRTPATIDIPDTMNFYRILSSDYGSCGITITENITEYMKKIRKNLKNSYKNTDKNNIKRIKTIISLLIKETKSQMNFYKTVVNGRTNVTVKIRNRYKKSTHHVHDFKYKKLIAKILSINLNVNDNVDCIYAIHNTMEINLMDYLDVIEHKGYLFFSLKQLFDLIKDVKYVLFLDMSCSGAEGNLNNNVILNNFKAKAQEMEGPSITNNITNYVNTSPYNTSPLGAGFNLVTGSNLNRTTKSKKSNKSNN
jgi:hypothetical protein